MAYWTTKEVASYLHLNEKKIYAMVAEGKLPAARISGKWLFEKDLVDAWVKQNTVHPPAGLLGHLVERLLVIQGSDDWLLERAISHLRETLPHSIVTATVGSMGGLRALLEGRAHLAGIQVAEAEVSQGLKEGLPSYLLDLFHRQQGLVLSPSRKEGVRTLGDLAEKGLRFALRQPGSGTHRLTERLLAAEGLSLADLRTVGPYHTHLEVALAVLSGAADAGLVIQVAADQAGLPFVPIHQETFRITAPAAFFGESPVARVLERLFAWLRAQTPERTPGYDLSPLGRLRPPAG
ncbi:MAG: helix-turn-helix transcriptional regulator [Polyangia bacterium]|nr:helix-turn-helix transcriptional regulator [Polyangia bacterium]